MADKIIFPLVYPDQAQANVQLGIYGSCVKIAMIMAMITQAFRYAYEPIVFAKSKVTCIPFWAYSLFTPASTFSKCSCPAYWFSSSLSL